MVKLTEMERHLKLLLYVLHDLSHPLHSWLHVQVLTVGMVGVGCVTLCLSRCVTGDTLPVQLPGCLCSWPDGRLQRA